MKRYRREPDRSAFVAGEYERCLLDERDLHLHSDDAFHSCRNVGHERRVDEAIEQQQQQRESFVDHRRQLVDQNVGQRDVRYCRHQVYREANPDRDIAPLLVARKGLSPTDGGPPRLVHLRLLLLELALHVQEANKRDCYCQPKVETEVEIEHIRAHGLHRRHAGLPTAEDAGKVKSRVREYREDHAKERADHCHKRHYHADNDQLEIERQHDGHGGDTALCIPGQIDERYGYRPDRLCKDRPCDTRHSEVD